jgi:deoxyribonuclease V
MEISASRMEQELWVPGARLLAGGVFAASRRGAAGQGQAGEPAWAAAAVFDSGRLVASRVVEGRFTAAYEPGYLALREGALLEQTVQALPLQPQVLLVNATGLDHPRAAGLAIHLGASLGIPTVGVTERRLMPGSDDDLTRAVVTLAGRRPVIVHAGWRTDLDTAIRIVKQLSFAARTPEPLREARRLARTARSAAQGGWS